MDLTLTIELVKRFEGFRAKPYLCPAGIATIGYGSTHYADGRPVTLADPPISKEDAHTLMEAELRHRYLPAVLRFCPSIRGTSKRSTLWWTSAIISELVDFRPAPCAEK